MQPEVDLCLGCMEPNGGEAVCPYCGYAADSPYMPSYLAPGVTLNGRYIAGRLLHHNGESALYIGYDKEKSVKVFIREYMPDTLCRRVKDSSVIAVNQNAVAQYKTFMSEFVELNKSLARLRSSDSIDPAIDMFGDNNTGYVIYNHVEGRPLSEVLKETGGVLSWEEVRKLFPPLFTTLSLIHNAGVVHRGICPENILVTPQKELVLINFCVADLRTAHTELNSEIYEGYAAPEQYSPGSWQGTWTDVYGICALLYRILTGTVPSEAEGRAVKDTLPEPVILNPSIPENVSAVIMQGLEPAGDKRIQTVTELVTKLFEEPEEVRVTHTMPIAVPRDNDGGDDYAEGFGRNSPRSHSTAKKQPKRHVVFLVVAGITTLVMLVFMGVLMYFLDDSSNIATDIKVPEETLADIEELASSLTYQTTAATESESPQPTLNEVENGTESVTLFDGKLYIMNDLIGKNYETIKNSPTYESLLFVPKYVFNEEIAKGIIIDQSVKQGETYEEGDEITITISRGSQYVTIPSYEGVGTKDYISLLDGLGIKYEQISLETKYYHHGAVCQVEPEPGEIFDLESSDTVMVYVAYNPAPETTTEEETDEPDETEETKPKKPKKTETETTVDDDPSIEIPLIPDDEELSYDDDPDED
ncbi:MAG: PASTA domain-containing protein [Oscillospiraceae bacterium]|nr:PASTA domain-containing protein [Oscillospiraceae bacterium]